MDFKKLLLHFGVPEDSLNEIPKKDVSPKPVEEKTPLDASHKVIKETPLQYSGTNH